MNGFRPIWSDIRLQCNTVNAWVMKNNDCYTQFSEQAVLELDNTAHHEPDIVSHLALIPMRYADITDELERQLVT